MRAKQEKAGHVCKAHVLIEVCLQRRLGFFCGAADTGLWTPASTCILTTTT
jgi:hypothetical protein